MMSLHFSLLSKKYLFSCLITLGVLSQSLLDSFFLLQISDSCFFCVQNGFRGRETLNIVYRPPTCFEGIIFGEYSF